MSIPNFSQTPNRATPAPPPPDRPVWLALGLCLVLGLIALGGRAVWKAADERARARALAQAQAGSVEAQLNAALDTAEVLGALVRQDAGRLPDFQSLASDLLRSHPGVAALALAPGGTIAEVAPRLGNESLLGRNLLTDPATRAETLGALQTRRLTVSGPRRLARGELGLVARLPVFLPGRDGRESLWGFVAVEVRLGETLQRAHLGELTAAGYRFILFTAARPGQPSATLAAAGNLQGRDYVQQAVRARDLELRLALQPQGGWYHLSRLALDGFALLLVALGVAAYVRLRGARVEAEAALTRANEKFARSLERFRALFEAAPDALCLTDRAGRVQEVNTQAETLFGYRREELAGQVLDKLLPQHLARLQPAGAERAPGSALELSAVRKDGKLFPAEVSWTSLPDPAGRETMICTCIRDVTRQTRAEAAANGWERQWRQFVASAPYAIAVHLPVAGNRIEQVNPRFTELFGYTAEEVPTLARWAELAYPDPAFRTGALSALVRQAELATTNPALREPVESVIRCKDGSERRISCTTTALGRRSLVILQELPAGTQEPEKPEPLETPASQSEPTMPATLADPGQASSLHEPPPPPAHLAGGVATPPDHAVVSEAITANPAHETPSLPASGMTTTDGSAEGPVPAPPEEPPVSLPEVVEPHIAEMSAGETGPEEKQNSVGDSIGVLEAPLATEPTSPAAAPAAAVPETDTADRGSAPEPHLEPLPEPPAQAASPEPSLPRATDAVPTVTGPPTVKADKAGRKPRARRKAEAITTNPPQPQAEPELTSSPDPLPNAIEVAPAAGPPAQPEVPALPTKTGSESAAITQPQIAPTPKPAAARRRKPAKDDQPFLLMVEPQLSAPDVVPAKPTVAELPVPLPVVPEPATAVLPPEASAPEAVAVAAPSSRATAEPAALADAPPAALQSEEIDAATVSDSGEPDLSAVEGLTPADGLLNVRDNRKQYLKLLRQFVTDHAGTAGQIRDLLVLGNSADAARLAHNVSGVAADLGAAGVQVAATGLERAIRQQADPAGIEMLWSQFEQALDTLIAELKPALKPKEEKVPTEPAAPVNPTHLRRAVHQIMPLLTDADPGATDCLDANRETLRSAFAPEIFREFEKHVRKGRFHEALDQLKKAAKKHGVSI